MLFPGLRDWQTVGLNVRVVSVPLATAPSSCREPTSAPWEPFLRTATSSWASGVSCFLHALTHIPAHRARCGRCQVTVVAPVAQTSAAAAALPSTQFAGLWPGLPKVPPGKVGHWCQVWSQQSASPQTGGHTRSGWIYIYVIPLPTKVCLVEAMVFPVVTYGCESWTIKMAEHQRIDAFKLWCWRRLLRVPWTARRSNQSVLKEINPEYSLEGLMLKLKHQYFGYLMWRADSL